MRKRISRDADNWGEEVIVDVPEHRRKSRNVASFVVGRNKANTVKYDEVGSEEVSGPITLKIETTPGGEELYTSNILEGERVRVYWGVKKVE